MIIDGHNHIGIRKGCKQTAEELIERMDKAEVDMAIAFNFVEAIDNDYVANAMKKYPNRIIGFACMNPWREDATEELTRCFKELGLKGVKLHPFIHGYPLSSHDITDPIFEVCAKYKAIVGCDGGDNLYTMPLHFREMAETFPEVNIVMFHSGFMYTTDQALIAAKKCENIFLGTTMVPSTLDIKMLLKGVGAERIVMGTDTPFGNFEISIATVKAVTQDPEERELILGGNYERLLGLKK